MDIKVNIVSIVISGLIIRIIYTIFDCIKSQCIDIFNEKEEAYDNLNACLVKIAAVTGVCLFIIILLLEFVKYQYVRGAWG
jgi:hypothetical protein